MRRDLIVIYLSALVICINAPRPAVNPFATNDCTTQCANAPRSVVNPFVIRDCNGDARSFC